MFNNWQTLILILMKLMEPYIELATFFKIWYVCMFYLAVIVYGPCIEIRHICHIHPKHYVGATCTSELLLMYLVDFRLCTR